MQGLMPFFEGNRKVLQGASITCTWASSNCDVAYGFSLELSQLFFLMLTFGSVHTGEV